MRKATFVIAWDQASQWGKQAKNGVTTPLVLPPPQCGAWSEATFAIQSRLYNPCKFKIFKTVMKYFLKHYKAQISFLIYNRQFEPLNA